MTKFVVNYGVTFTGSVTVEAERRRLRRLRSND